MPPALVRTVNLAWIVASSVGLAFATPASRGQTAEAASATAAHGPEMLRQLSGARFMLGPALLPMTNAAFSASFESQSKQLLVSGTTITESRTGRVARDGAGRTYNEVTYTRGPAGSEHNVTNISIRDTAGGWQISLSPLTHTAHTLQILQPATSDISQPKLQATRDQSATVTGTSQSPARFLGPNIQREELGFELIDGVTVRHYRETQTIAVGQAGNDQEMIVTAEFWYSAELRLNLKAKRIDPRLGEETLTLTDLQLGEPPASLFEIPPDYKVIELHPPVGSAVTSGSAGITRQQP